MSPEVVSLGEILVEIMRKDRDVPHSVPGVYLGPYPSGAPAIFIDAAANLGLKAGFIGVVGEDEFGELLLERLRKDGVDISHIRVLRGYTTGTTFVMYYSSGARRFIFHLRHSAAGQLSPEDVDEDYIAESRLLHIMGSSLAVSESSRRACMKALRAAEKSDVTITFDPNLRAELLDVETIRRICQPVIGSCKVILPSRDEAKALTGTDDPVEAGKRLIRMGHGIGGRSNRRGRRIRRGLHIRPIKGLEPKKNPRIRRGCWGNKGYEARPHELPIINKRDRRVHQKRNEEMP